MSNITPQSAWLNRWRKRRWPRGLAPSQIIGGVGNPYLWRWYLLPKNWRLNLYLHHFCRSDDDRALHDHPWWNVSVLLTGSYREFRPDGMRVRRRFRPILRRATQAHRIEVDRPVWTLFLTGPKIRDWGFWCPRGWRRWQDFTTPDGSDVEPGCE